MANNPEFKQPPIMWRVIWAALFSGIFVIYFVAGSSEGARAGSAAADSPVWMVGFVPFVVSAIVRWLILPLFRSSSTAFSCFIVGLAMGEMPCILGFVFPAHRLELFLLSVLGLFQFIPYSANRFADREN
jgi:hypothetical protein